MFILKMTFVMMVLCFPYSLSADEYDDLLNEAYSIFYGEVVSGSITKTEAIFGGVDRRGSYVVQVVRNLGGVELSGNQKVEAFFPGVYVGSGGVFPAPGVRYVFIINKKNGALEFNQYKLAYINAEYGNVIYTPFQQVVEGVEDYCRGRGVISRCSVMEPDERKVIGYDVLQYLDYISQRYEKIKRSK